MNALMHCKHHKTKQKLVFHAKSWRGKHFQWLEYKECWIECGCVKHGI